MPCIAKAFAWMGEHWEGVMALAAVVVAVYEVHATRKHNRLSVTPCLDISTTVDSRGGKKIKMLLELHNLGLGPARILRMTICLDGKVLEKGTGTNLLTLAMAAETVTKDFPSYTDGLGAPDDGTVLPSGHTQALIEWEMDNTKNFTNEMARAHLERIDFVVDYESLYQEKQPPLDTRVIRGKPRA